MFGVLLPKSEKSSSLLVKPYILSSNPIKLQKVDFLRSNTKPDLIVNWHLNLDKSNSSLIASNGWLFNIKISCI